MYQVPVGIKDSAIEGKGVFALEDIKQNTIVWVFDPQHDKQMSLENFEKLAAAEKQVLEKVGYISAESNQWIYPPENDPARFTNHSKDNNLSVISDRAISIEPIFVARRDIKAGEELTNNYLEFDVRTVNDKSEWI